jgi:hypothetical protein
LVKVSQRFPQMLILPLRFYSLLAQRIMDESVMPEKLKLKTMKISDIVIHATSPYPK